MVQFAIFFIAVIMVGTCILKCSLVGNLPNIYFNAGLQQLTEWKLRVFKLLLAQEERCYVDGVHPIQNVQSKQEIKFFSYCNKNLN